MGELGLLATYPMLEPARSWLREHGPSMETLLVDIAYNRARDRALRHVWDALEGGLADTRAPTSDVEAEMVLLSRPLARVIVAAVEEPFLVSRFAVWESKRVSKVLERAPVPLVQEVAAALEVPVGVHEGDDGVPLFAMKVTDYLWCAPNEKAWHLVRRDLQKGMVRLDQEGFARLVEEVYRRFIDDELRQKAKQVPAFVREAFAGQIERLKNEVQERLARRKQEDLQQVVPGLFPPCMTQILKDMHEHVNVPHMGRFAIVSFLHHLSLDTDAILEFFSTVPDFDPEKSRYQIEHITGKGSPDAYKPPGCSAMQSYGVCPLSKRDSLCMKIKHPLSYYRKALWREKVRDQESEGADQGRETTPQENAVLAAAKTAQTEAKGGQG
jgi:DNA primase large subunit